MFTREIKRINTKSKNGKKMALIDYKGKVTRKQMQNIANEISKGLKKKGAIGKVSVNLKYGDDAPLPRKWNSMGMVEIGKEVPLFRAATYYDNDDNDWEEPKFFKRFQIIVTN